jgi:small neutral amino acid transporter SnatA (MarC family)
VVEKSKAHHSRLASMPFTMTPDYVVSFMILAVISKSPPHRFLIGFGAWLAVVMRIIIPTRVSDYVIRLVNNDSFGEPLSKRI